MKKFITLALLALSFCVAKAQFTDNIDFGVRAGMNLSKIGISEDNMSLGTDTRAGFNVGLAVEIPLTKGDSPNQWRINTGLSYTVKGCKIKERGSKLTVSPAYLQLPVYASFRHALSDNVCLRINAGPYLAVGVNGKIKATEGRASVEEDCFSDDELKRFDAGLGVSAGLGFRMFVFEIGYEHGLVNIARDSEIKFRNRNFTLTLGYNF